VGRWIITVVCLAGLGVAGALAWRWRGLEHEARDSLPDGWEGVRRALRSIAVAVDTALVVGVLVGGLGGRLFMRILAATSGEAAQGATTQANETVGKITFGGTVALIIFGGMFAGLVVAVVYRALRQWLPARAWQAGLILAVLSLGIGGRGSELLNPDNGDFVIVRPLWLAVTLVALLAAIFGVVFVTVHERLDRAVPEIGLSFGSLAYVPMIVAMLVPPVTIVVILVALLSTRAGRVGDWWSSVAVRRAGRVLTTVLVGLSAAVALSDAATILV
jgi:hypothetical protein